MFLSTPILIAKIPLHLLRFARRGRRKLQVLTGIIERHTGQILARADACIEYVACCEGYVEIQERREAVLRAGVEIACAIAADEPFNPRVAEVIGDWVADKTRRFTPRSNVLEPLSRLEASHEIYDIAQPCECILAWGQKADAVAAMSLALQVAALYPTLSAQQEQTLWALAEGLELSRDRFTALCQKYLLTDNCTVQRWRLLLGVRQDLTPEQLRLLTNEEYRKWNARITHRSANPPTSGYHPVHYRRSPQPTAGNAMVISRAQLNAEFLRPDLRCSSCVLGCWCIGALWSPPILLFAQPSRLVDLIA